MKKKKNILLILCDQLRADFLGIYGGPNVTPNIDNLAKKGTVFNKAYSVYPVCVAARMTMLTGMHPATCPPEIPKSVPTVADLLSSAGFYTAAFGKMHMVPPRGPYGFKELILSEDTGPGMFLDDYHPWLANQGFVEWGHGLDNYDLLSVKNSLLEDKTVTSWSGNLGVNFLKRQTSSSPPFLAVISFAKPHPPYDPPAAWADLVKPENAPPPVGLERPWSEYPKYLRLYAEAFGYLECEKLGKTREIRAHYLGLVAQIDQQIGRILKTLDEQDLADNTLVIFSADHGDFLGDHHLFMKFFPYEASAHIPLIMRGAGLPAGRTEIPVSHLDFVPTLLDFCGKKAPLLSQGTSLLKLLRENGRKRTGVLIQFADHGFCRVTRRYKYAFWPDGEEELFDLEKDQHEIKNIAGIYPELCLEMRKAMLQELVDLDKQRLGNMPPLLADGQLLIEKTNPERFKNIAGRFMPHRLPVGYNNR